MRNAMRRWLVGTVVVVGIAAGACSSDEGTDEPQQPPVTSDGTPAGDLAVATSRWEDVYPAYVFTLERRCDCPAVYTEPVSINVRDDEVTGVAAQAPDRRIGEHEDYPTIADLLRSIAVAIDDGTLVSVDYDSRTGAPSIVELDSYDGVTGPVTLLVGEVGENLPA